MATKKIPHIKICKLCTKSFRPHISDEDFKELFFDDRQQELFNLFTVDSINCDYQRQPRLNHPRQELCGKCSLKKDVYVEYAFGGYVYKQGKNK